MSVVTGTSLLSRPNVRSEGIEESDDSKTVLSNADFPPTLCCPMKHGKGFGKGSTNADMSDREEGFSSDEKEENDLVDSTLLGNQQDGEPNEDPPEGMWGKRKFKRK